jgi:DNA-binding NarL/FixJ family response regulator
VLARASEAVGGDVLRRAALLLLGVRAALATGPVTAAAGAVAELGELAARSDAAVVAGMHALAAGLVAADDDRDDDARQLLDTARATFQHAHRPLLAAEAGLALAELCTGADAIAAARSAHAIGVRLDAPTVRDRAAALLRAHGVAAPRASASGRLPELTAREAEILDGIRRGDTNAQIAARLYLSPKTVEHHVSRVLAKLGVRTRAEAAAIGAAATLRP